LFENQFGVNDENVKAIPENSGAIFANKDRQKIDDANKTGSCQLRCECGHLNYFKVLVFEKAAQKDGKLYEKLKFFPIQNPI
jgi:hypothetical protein